MSHLSRQWRLASARATPIPHLRLAVVEVNVLVGQQLFLHDGVLFTDTAKCAHDSDVVKECSTFLVVHEPRLRCEEGSVVPTQTAWARGLAPSLSPVRCAEWHPFRPPRDTLTGCRRSYVPHTID